MQKVEITRREEETEKVHPKRRARLAIGSGGTPLTDLVILTGTGYGFIAEGRMRLGSMCTGSSSDKDYDIQFQVYRRRGNSGDRVVLETWYVRFVRGELT